MQNLMSQTDTVTIDICDEHMSVVKTEYTSYNRNLSIVVAGCYNIKSVDVTLLAVIETSNENFIVNSGYTLAGCDH